MTILFLIGTLWPFLLWWCLHPSSHLSRSTAQTTINCKTSAKTTIAKIVWYNSRYIEHLKYKYRLMFRNHYIVLKLNFLQRKSTFSKLPEIKPLINISALEHSTLASWRSFILLPIDAFNVSPASTDTYNVVGDFLFVDYQNREIWIHFWGFMPDEQNSMRKESLSGLGIPYENIHPPLKTLRITDEERAKFPAYYDIPDVPEYAKSYKEQYLQDTIWKDYIPFYYQPLVEADFDTFVLWTGRVYAADKNKVYILLRQDIPRKIEGEIADYTVLEKNGNIQYPFYTIIEWAYPIEGNQIDNPFYLVQNGGVWYKGTKLEGANPNAEILYHWPSYFVQADGARFHSTKIPEADPLTFRVVREYPSYGYAVDANYFYTSDTLVPPEGFWWWYRYLNEYAQIKDNPLYYNNTLVKAMKSTIISE